MILYKRTIDFHGITIKINICKVSRIFHVIFTRMKMVAYITGARTSRVMLMHKCDYAREREKEKE